MPRFSVIVPVYKVQGYLRECLDSILTQSCTDIEVIAVDDCSPDNCGNIIDEYAARDARVTAVHLPRNVGLGRARNAGVGHATGEYLLFLDSDDSYTPEHCEPSTSGSPSPTTRTFSSSTMCARTGGAVAAGA